MTIYIMGVSGSGKSTIGQKLAKAMGAKFFDGDDFHPLENVSKMSKGIALTDADRKGWLLSIRNKAKSQTGTTVFACSALKEKYRLLLSEGLEDYAFVYLKGSKELILQRMRERNDHFMPTTLLDSQFEILEPPAKGIEVSIELEPNTIVSEILKKLNRMEFGLIGLGVMGKSLARNLARNGFSLSLYNRFVAGSEEKVAERFIQDFEEFKKAKGFEDLRSFVASLARPRKVFLMVNAGAITDLVINDLLELLEDGDLIIDGGNAFFKDTERRIATCKKRAVLFLGSGVSGGEKGALEGPSVMPGGSKEAYMLAEKYLTAIAAKDPSGGSCCTYIGEGGSGHYVKMVHNGIEYAEMQLIAEVYALMRYALGMDICTIADTFETWNEGTLSSYLLEISHKLLRQKEGENYMLDIILDKAGNKGTGSWTTINMAELGIPATMISSALFARYISAFKEKRDLYASKYLFMDKATTDVDIKDLKEAYRLARIVNHNQGFNLISTASETYNWNIHLPSLARIWTNGCIIRSYLMEKISTSLSQDEPFLLQYSQKEMEPMFRSLRNVSTMGIQSGVSIPCMLAAVDFLNAHLINYPTANMIQAQRDFFGAHTFQRVDDPNGPFHHHFWE